MNPPEVSERALLKLVQRASSLAERLEYTTAYQEDEGDPVLIEKRLEEWCWAVAKGNWDTFRKRLAWDGLDVETVRRALGPVRLPDHTPLPAWADTLRDALSLAAAMPENEAVDAGVATSRFLHPEQPLPFEELLAPFVLVARQQLAARAGAAYRLLSDTAHASLERALLAVLSACSSRALQLEFSLLRVQEQSPLARLLALGQDSDDCTLYHRFVQRMRWGGLLPFFQEYAVLARLLGTATCLWVEAHAELLQRLATDWPALQHLFAGDGELGPVMAIQPSLSDPHRGRRSVAALTFTSGRKLVYKPKDLGTEEAYNRLLAWLNERGAPLPFKVLAVLNRFTHGWVEYVERVPCTDRAEAGRYYRRAGMLLCLVYALEGTDCHLENIIASGEHPILVDLETLLHHRARQEDWGDGTQAYFLAYQELAHSVLRTGFLPVWQLGNDGRIAYDISGLGGFADQETPFRAPRWDRVNTDRMALEYEPHKIRPTANVPILHSVALRLDGYTEEVVAGFGQMYRFLVDCRGALLAPDSPLHRVADQRVRFVHRASRVYALLLRKLLDPDYLRDGADRSIQLEVLSRSLMQSEEKSRWWPIVAAEQQAMEQGDIPFFTARTRSGALEVAPGQLIEGCFSEPSFHLVLARLRALGDEDLKRQVAFIEGSFYAHVARDGESSPTAEIAEASAAAARPLASEHLVARALSVAGELRQRAICAADGSATWIAPQYLAQAERFQLQPIGYDLYGGACGIALFLAAVEKATGGAGYRPLALGAVRLLRRELRARGDRVAGQLRIGGAAGLGGIVYALVRTGQLLDEPALLEDARQAASLVTDDQIAADTRLDVMLGAAGAILGLLALYDATRDQEVIRRAMACGHHLLNTRTASEAGHRCWGTSGGKLLTGFSHGAAGITYALLRLYQTTRDTDLLEAAREGIAYERSVFSREAGNWPDLRRDDGPRFAIQWCHGASGIGLGRLGGLPVLDTAEIRQDIEIALQTTRRLGLQTLDHLCCGNLGRGEVLLAAGLRLSRPDLIEAAGMRAAQVVARAEQTGGFPLHPLLPRSVYQPGFFQGTAGIGYALLRLAHPALLPSVLLWE